MPAVSEYAGSVRNYAAMVKYGAYIDVNDPIGKNKWINRTRIIGANGVQTLTIPIVKPERGSHTPLKDIIISEHGNWAHNHWGAIFSAYGKSPFFEYYQDDLHDIYANHGNRLCDFLLAIHDSVCEFFDLPITMAQEESIRQCDTDSIHDVEYYQVWHERHGFVPGLSILDLVLNEGREASLILQRML